MKNSPLKKKTAPIPTETRKRVKALQRELDDYSYHYYVLNQSLVSDAVFDQKMHQLKALEAEFPSLCTSESPSQKVGSKVAQSKFAKAKHTFPMLSIKDVHNQASLLDFDKVNCQMLGVNQIAYCCELKIDGVSLSLVYQKHKLQQALTRGNGTEGSVITNNALCIKDVLPSIKADHDLVIRGEVFLDEATFQVLNQASQLNDKTISYVNPRNAASGLLQNIEDTKDIHTLKAFWYACYGYPVQQVQTQIELLQFLKKLGFSTEPHFQLCDSMDEVWAFIQKIEKIRFQLAFGIDGIVIKVNDINFQKQLGANSKAPRWAVAYKFAPKTAITTIKAIVPSVKKTGLIHYKALLAPVMLARTTIKAATLVNPRFIQERDLRINDEVEIRKAGDIIPEVMRVIKTKKSKRHPVWKPVIHCPSCQTTLLWTKTKSWQYCPNRNKCPGQIFFKTIYFVSKPAMDIMYLSEKNLQKLFEAELVTSYWDIFKLPQQYKAMLKIERMGITSVRKLIDNINKSKKLNADRLLTALGIPHIGPKRAQFLMESYPNLLEYHLLTKTQICNLRTFNAKLAEQVIAFFANKNHQKQLQLLAKQGVNVKYLKANNNQSLANLKFVITGKLTRPRLYFVNLITANGGKIMSAISANANYLLTGPKGLSTKTTKAKAASQYAVKVINEQQLLKLLQKDHYE